ncbi:(deoxy)nucleoside triphosphate pyrophosphohydrolase [Nocardioides sp. CER19]|uniref:(deoxy)nucleoside triphosphate pyrophosphohydrolase n=1 Tax=Nocardioides sp. CER19 TaxID=3038538 RepID=UPI00244CE46A|nr:(deoxy)nucleoside triphosphate pyrophosphohydrolase [Nocardioides sp. CER19]MDH2414991.1 (deoxy)nucleoside triphosphate pyrophosphohydrolase [Nocardioides sp. CER19]
MEETDQLVVGAALIRGGSVLAARRTRPPAAAGGWEFPGGKVEPGEDPDAAVVREVAEELGCTVEVTGWLTLTVPISESLTLRVATARLVRGEPAPVEQDPSHDAVRWLRVDELDEVAWLDADRPFLPELDALLAELGRRLRGIFFDEDAAAAVAGRLRADGWDVEVLRERYHGEDDDEDHPWAVVSDAPEAVMELLVDEHDGWLDGGDPPLPGSTPPLDLPTAPRRVKRPPQ